MSKNTPEEIVKTEEVATEVSAEETAKDEKKDKKKEKAVGCPLLDKRPAGQYNKTRLGQLHDW